MDDLLIQQTRDNAKCLMGCALFDTEGADKVLALTRPEWYRDARYAVLWQIFADERKRGAMPDIAIIMSKFAARIGVSEKDASLILHEAMEAVSHSANVGFYARCLHDAWVRQEGGYVLTKAKRKLTDPTVETPEVLGQSIESLQQLLAGSVNDCPMKAGQVFLESLALDGSAAVPTGFVEIDTLTGGLCQGSMTVCGARPSVGKTSLALEVARRITQFGVPTLFFSLEMTRRSILQRLASMSIGVPFAFIRDGKLNATELSQAESIASQDWMQRLYIDEQLRRVDEMAGIVRLYRQRFGVRMVVLDYLQLVQPANERQPREVQVATISRGLKALAKSANVAILVLAQLNRELERRDQKRPKISDLRESGSIEADADQCWLLWRPNQNTDADDDHGELIVAKSRNGQTGTVKLAWHGPSMTYSDAVATCDEPEMPDEWK